MKLMFILEMIDQGLLTRGLFPSDWERYMFVPYRYGPYSKQLADDCSELEDLKLLQVQRLRVDHPTFDDGPGTLQIFRLSESGLNIASKLEQDLSTEAISMIRDLAKYNRLSLRDLVTIVYYLYPEFAKGSWIKDEL
jgi:uncharacterized protein YwgA